MGRSPHGAKRNAGRSPGLRAARSIRATDRRENVSRAGKHGAGKAAVVVHVADEVGDAVEAQLGSDPADEGDVEGAAVKLLGEIEQVHFEQRRAVPKGRPAAEIG